MDVVHVTAFAKLNLFLEVHGVRADGYHELDTVMHEIDLGDRVSVARAADAVVLDVSDPTVGTGEDNLAVKAVRALEAETGRALPCRIHLEKHIPAGGGLGGGSSDAAAVLRALDRVHGLGLDAGTLERVAATFGSDTSFFVRGGTSRCRGRGEIVEPMSGVPKLWFVLVLPMLHVPTPSVFKALRLTGSPRESYDFRSRLVAGDVARLRGSLFNRLESAARECFPAVRELLDELAPWRPLLSGSGSSIFVLCKDEAEAQATRVALRDRSRGRWETRVAASAQR